MGYFILEWIISFWRGLFFWGWVIFWGGLFFWGGVFFWGATPSPAGLQRGQGDDLLEVHDEGLQPLLQVRQVLLPGGGGGRQVTNLFIF